MKLYTKNSLILSSVLGVLLCVGLFIIANKVGIVCLKIGETSVSEKIEEDKNIGANIDSKKNADDGDSTNVNSLSATSCAEVSADSYAIASNLSSYTQDELQNINVYEKCNEAVVNINTQVTGINWFLEPIVQEGGSGSGSIIDERGYVITNVHVVENATRIYISLYDGTQLEGVIVGQDSESDIAVLHFEPPKNTVLKTISFGDSKSLKVGQKVIAIGNPFGLERTMTTGIVSGLGRPIQNSNNTIIRDMIQTDTAINPGNSGGPLLDTSGRMIGINTMIYSSSGNSAGVGFAVPSETARRVAFELIKNGKVNRGVIQASMIQLNSSIARYANLDIDSGILVSEVLRGGNADRAGILGGSEAVRYGRKVVYLGGDIITKIDGIKIATIADYYSALESKRPNDTINVTIHRNRKDVVLKVKLAENSSQR